MSNLKEVGSVVDLQGDLALVELNRSKACKACGVCCLGADGKKMLTEAANKARAGVGDSVYIELEPRSILIASFIVYVLPLFFLVTGYLIGTLLISILFGKNNAEAGGIAVGFAGLALSYLVIRLVDKKLSKAGRFQPVIAEVVEAKK